MPRPEVDDAARAAETGHVVLAEATQRTHPIKGPPCVAIKAVVLRIDMYHDRHRDRGLEEEFDASEQGDADGSLIVVTEPFQRPIGPLGGVRVCLHNHLLGDYLRDRLLGCTPHAGEHNYPRPRAGSPTNRCCAPATAG